MTIGLFIAAFLLLIYALAVRFTGTSKILNFVDYEKISDPMALHTWVGNRLLALAFVTLTLAIMTSISSLHPIFYLLGFIIAVVVAIGWLVFGAGKFQGKR